jgi:hypothetical protein
MEGFMRKAVFYIFILLAMVSCGGLKDPMEAPELKGQELDNFLRFPIRYGPNFQDDPVRDIFYSGGLVEGMEILAPRKLGTVDKVKHYAIIIQQTDNPGNYTVLFFEDTDAQVTRFTKLQQGELTRYQNAMNPFLLDLFPRGYFEQAAIDIAEYGEGGQLAQQQTTGTNYSDYTNILMAYDLAELLNNAPNESKWAIGLSVMRKNNNTWRVSNGGQYTDFDVPARLSPLYDENENYYLFLVDASVRNNTRTITVVDIIPFTAMCLEQRIESEKAAKRWVL